MARWLQRRRDTAILEARRLEGRELLLSGLRQCEVARRLGVSRAAVSRWDQRASRGGLPALLSHPRSGRPSRLSASRRAELSTLLSLGAESFGFPGERWSLVRLAEAGAQTWGVRYSKTGLRRILLGQGYRWRPHLATPGRSDSLPPAPDGKASRQGWVLGVRLPVERGGRMFSRDPVSCPTRPLGLSHRPVQRGRGS